MARLPFDRYYAELEVETERLAAAVSDADLKGGCLRARSGRSISWFTTSEPGTDGPREWSSGELAHRNR